MNSIESVFILHNPNSGNGLSERNAKLLTAELKKKGVSNITVFKSETEARMPEIMKELKTTGKTCDVFIVLGGDGTVGLFVTEMLKSGLDFNIAIYPQGTANDFAKYHKLKKITKHFVKVVLKGNFVKSDVAFVNKKYCAVNVVDGGAFSNHNMQFKRHFKKFFGKLGYYIKCLSMVLFHLSSQELEFTIDGKTTRARVYIYFILNTSGAGGLRKICKDADISDGKFNFIAVKKCSKFILPFLFLKILLGLYKNSKRIIFQTGREFNIKAVGAVHKAFEHSDLDGNHGPSLPLHVQVSKQRISVLTNKKELVE